MNNQQTTPTSGQRIFLGLALMLIAGLLWGAILAPVARADAPVFVRPAGDDLFCDGTANVDYSPAIAPACAVKTLSRAISLAGSVNTIVIATGDSSLAIPPNLPPPGGISVAAAALSVDKSDVSDPVSVGNSLTYTIRISNTGDTPANNVDLIDVLPQAGIVSYRLASSTQGSCNLLSGNVISCTLGTLNVGTPITVTAVVTPVAAGMINNSVVVRTSNPGVPNALSDEFTRIEGVTNLAVRKTDFYDPVIYGQALTYTLTVTNSGPSAAVAVDVTDYLPTGATFASVTPSQGACNSGSIVTCTMGLMNGSSIATITLVVTPTNLGLITNTVTVTGGDIDPDLSNNIFTQTTTVIAPVDLSITKTYSQTTLRPGDRLTFTLIISNPSSFPASGVVITETLPTSTTFAGPPGWLQVGASNQYTRAMGSLPPTSTVTTTFIITLPASLPVGTNFFTNVVRVGHSDFETNPANNVYTLPFSIVVSPLLPDLWAVKNDNEGPGAFTLSMAQSLANSASGLSIMQMFDAMSSVTAEAVPEGGLITYTIGYGNSSSGQAPATGVVLSETLPLYTTYAGPACGQWRGWCQVGSTRTYTYLVGGPLNPSGGDATEFIVRVNSSVPVTQVVNSVCIYGNQADLIPGNNCSNEQTPVVAGAFDLSVTKTENATCLNPGDTINYAINVQNLGVNTATQVIITETVPANTTAVNPPGSGWAAVGGGVFTYSLGLLSGGGGQTIPFLVQINPGLGPSVTAVTNTVRVGANGLDSNPANNIYTRTTALGTTPDLVITKNDNTSVPVGQNGLITYTIGYLNNSYRFTATNVVITDTLPPGTIITGPTASLWQQVGSVYRYNHPGGQLAPNTSGSVQLTVQLTSWPYPSSEVVNTVQIGSAQPECDLTDNTATEETPVAGVPPTADLTVVKDDNIPFCAAPGDTIGYTITYSNTSFSIPATNVMLTETIDPAAVNFLGPLGWSGGGSTYTRAITPSLAPRAGGVEAFNVQVSFALPAWQTYITNVVRIGSTSLDNNSANNIYTLTTYVPVWPDLMVIKNDNVGPSGLSAMAGLDDLLARLQFSPEAEALLQQSLNREGQLSAAELVNPGDVITYTIILGNIGRAVSNGTVLTETLPAGATFVGPGYWQQVGSSNQYTYTVGTLNPGIGDVLQFIVRVNNPFNATSPLINRVQIDGLGDECNTTNNSSTDETPVSGGGGPNNVYLPIIIKPPLPPVTPTPIPQPPTPTPTPVPLAYVSDVKVHTETSQIFIASPRHDWVYVINGANNLISRNVPVGHGPTGLTVLKGPDKVFVAHQYGYNFWHPGFTAFGVNENDDHLTTDSGYPGAAPVKTAANSPNNRRVYVSNYYDKLAVYDGASGPPENRLGWVVQKGFQGAYGIDTSAATNRVYLATRDTGELVVFDGNGDRLLQSSYIPTHVKPEQPCSLWSVAVNETTGHVFVPCPQLGRVFVLQESQFSLLDLEALGVLEVREEGLALVVSPQAAPWIANISVPSGTGLGEEGIAAVNSATGYVFITNARNDEVVILQDGPTPTYVTKVTVGDMPQGVDVNPTTQRVYVGNAGSNSVTVLNAIPPFNVIATIPLTP